MVRQSDIVLEKYWVTQSGYFRFSTTAALGVGIIDGKLLYCHGVAEGNQDKKKSTSEYNNRTVYYCFNNIFTVVFLDQICIYLPLPLMIDPTCIKDPNITQIFSQLPSLLPLKIMLVLWPPLLIIIILSMLWRWMCLSLVGCTDDTAVGKTTEKGATKRQVSIAPHALIR